MLIIPAIDLKDGLCVRLRQGRMEDDTVFSDDPVAVAKGWVDRGARRVHLVDLDGAFAGEPRNGEVIRSICTAVAPVPVQVGGGIRNDAQAAAYIDAGVRWLIIGTQAVREPEFVDRLCQRYPGQIIVGLDARDGQVAVEGWAEASGVEAVSLARRFDTVGVTAIVYTDISRDGMMQGVNTEATGALANAVPIPVIASGGVSTLADIAGLGKMPGRGVAGAIVGRALYEDAFDFTEAQQLADTFAAAASATDPAAPSSAPASGSS